VVPGDGVGRRRGETGEKREGVRADLRVVSDGSGASSCGARKEWVCETGGAGGWFVQGEAKWLG
jgi:hypothetical protein